DPGVLRLLSRLLRTSGRRAADVERAHRQLRARLADRLRGDHADRLAQLDRPAGGEVPPVALDAYAPARFAGEHRSDLDLLEPRRLDLTGDVFIDLLVPPDDQVAGERIVDVLHRHAADEAVAQRLDDLAPFDDRGDVDPLDGLAVVLGDDHVLRHVHQAPGEVARVGRLEGRVGEPLAGPVRGDEVL